MVLGDPEHEGASQRDYKNMGQNKQYIRKSGIGRSDGIVGLTCSNKQLFKIQETEDEEGEGENSQERA